MTHGLRRKQALLISVLIPLLGTLGWTTAATVPTIPGLAFQTSGPSRDPTIGDWYTTATSSNTTRFHRFNIIVTQDQLDAAGGSLALTVNDAESTAGAAPQDEVNGGQSDPTRFTLTTDATATPTGAAKLKQQTFPAGSPDGSTFTYTLTAAGSYYLLSETGAKTISTPSVTTVAANDDDNAFTITVGGSNFTPTIGQYQSSFQHDATLSYKVYFFVAPGTAGPLALRNFDMDAPAGTTLTYVRPDGTTAAGTISKNGVWNNNGTLNTGADSVAVGNSYGWWAMDVKDMTGNNQAIYEANDGAGNRLPAVFSSPVALNLSKTVSNAAPRVGDTVTYTVTLTNGPDLGATGIYVRDLLPAGLTYLSASLTQPTNSSADYNAVTGDWHVRNLNALASATLNIQARVAQTGTVTNTATLQSVDQPFTPKSAAVALTATATSADLTVHKTGSASVVQGSPASYTITVWNKGINPTSGAVITDAVPSNLTGVSWTCAAAGGASCGSVTSGAGNAISLTTGTLPVNASAAVPPTTGAFLTLRVTGTATTPGTFTNTAAITAATGVTDPAGNNSSSQVTVVTNPNLACSTTMYGLFGDFSTLKYRTIAPVTPTGTVGATVATIPLNSNDRNYSLGVSADGSKLFVGGADGTLKIYDVGTGQWAATSPAIPGTTTSPYRIGITAATPENPGGTGYLSSGNKLWVFQTAAPYTVTALTDLIYTDTSGLNPAPTLGGPTGSGDFFADAAGNLYLSVSNQAAFIDTVKINPATSVAHFVGRVASSVISATDDYGGFAALGTQIYGATLNGQFVEYDLAALTVRQTAAVNGTRAASDLASCVYPDLQAAVAASKTVQKVAGSAGAVIRPGDTLEYTILVRNAGTIGAPDTKFQDGIPVGTSYVTGSTRLNTVAVPDAAGGVMPFVTARAIGSPGVGSGLLLVDTTPSVTTDREATITFRVTINPTALPLQVSNQGTATYVGNTATVSVLTDDPAVAGASDPTVTPVITPPSITLTKLVRNASTLPAAGFVDSGIGVKPGEILEYCVAYRNTGSAATNFVIQDYVPFGMVIVPNAYETGKGVRHSSSLMAGIGDTAAPAGTNLTNTSDTDAGTLSGVPTPNPSDPPGSPLRPGALTLSLASMPGSGQGTVCFQVRVP